MASSSPSNNVVDTLQLTAPHDVKDSFTGINVEFNNIVGSVSTLKFDSVAVYFTDKGNSQTVLVPYELIDMDKLKEISCPTVSAIRRQQMKETFHYHLLIVQKCLASAKAAHANFGDKENHEFWDKLNCLFKIAYEKGHELLQFISNFKKRKVFQKDDNDLTKTLNEVLNRANAKACANGVISAGCLVMPNDPQVSRRFAFDCSPALVSTTQAGFLHSEKILVNVTSAVMSEAKKIQQSSVQDISRMLSDTPEFEEFMKKSPFVNQSYKAVNFVKFDTCAALLLLSMSTKQPLFTVVDGNHRAAIDMDLYDATVYKDLEMDEIIALSSSKDSKVYEASKMNAYFGLIWQVMYVMESCRGASAGYTKLNWCERNVSYNSSDDCFEYESCDTSNEDTSQFDGISSEIKRRNKLENVCLDVSWVWLAYNEPCVFSELLDYAIQCYKNNAIPLAVKSIFNVQTTPRNVSGIARTFHAIKKLSGEQLTVTASIAKKVYRVMKDDWRRFASFLVLSNVKGREPYSLISTAQKDWENLLNLKVSFSAENKEKMKSLLEDKVCGCYVRVLSSHL